jgi:protein SCO1/2
VLESAFTLTVRSAAALLPRAAPLACVLALLAACGEPPVAIGGPFSLVDETGETVTDRDLRGRPFVVYFGFTFCPDVCPLALTKLGLALDMLGPDADRFQTIFITIDPERDTPEQLALYVRSHGFPKNLIGLTGSPEQIRAVADAYRVYYKKIQSQQTTAPYLMEHTSVLYLMGADGRFADVFTHAATPEEIAEGLRRLLAEG